MQRQSFRRSHRVDDWHLPRTDVPIPDLSVLLALAGNGSAAAQRREKNTNYQSANQSTKCNLVFAKKTVGSGMSSNEDQKPPSEGHSATDLKIVVGTPTKD